MPIRINLLAEAQAAEELRRRDPVKRGLWIGGFIIFLAVAYIGKLQLDIWREGMTRKRLERNWIVEEPKYKALLAQQEKAEKLHGLLNDLDRYSTNRFLWGNVLNALQKSLVDDIQITRIKGEQTYDITRSESITNQTPLGDQVTHKKGQSSERIRLVIEARDWNNQSQTWTKYKESLAKYDYFRRHLTPKDNFVLDGTTSAPMRDPLNPTREYVSFSLVSKFPEVHRYE
jgi:hypothetical protein